MTHRDIAARFLATVLGALIIVVVAYHIKCALGINLIPNRHMLVFEEKK